MTYRESSMYVNQSYCILYEYPIVDGSIGIPMSGCISINLMQSEAWKFRPTMGMIAPYYPDLWCWMCTRRISWVVCSDATQNLHDSPRKTSKNHVKPAFSSGISQRLATFEKDIDEPGVQWPSLTLHPRCSTTRMLASNCGKRRPGHPCPQGGTADPEWSPTIGSWEHRLKQTCQNNRNIKSFLHLFPLQQFLDQWSPMYKYMLNSSRFSSILQKSSEKQWTSIDHGRLLTSEWHDCEMNLLAGHMLQPW